MDGSKKEQDDPVLQMRGVGREIWADTNADDYVRDLRSESERAGEGDKQHDVTLGE